MLFSAGSISLPRELADALMASADRPVLPGPSPQLVRSHLALTLENSVNHSLQRLFSPIYLLKFVVLLHAELLIFIMADQSTRSTRYHLLHCRSINHHDPSVKLIKNFKCCLYV